MPHEMTFEEELIALLKPARLASTPHVEIELAVAALHRKHGREVPPPIIGTMAVLEPKDMMARILDEKEQQSCQ